MDQFNMLSQQDIDDYLSGKSAGKLFKIEEAIKELVLANPIALRNMMKRLLNNSPKNNQMLAQAVHKLGGAYWGCFNEEIEKKHINSVDLGKGVTNEIENGKFRTKEGIARAIDRNREDVGKLMDALGIKKNGEGAYKNSDVILIKDLFDNYKSKDRVQAGKNLLNGHKLSYIKALDLLIQKSKKLKGVNKRTGIFD